MLLASQLRQLYQCALKIAIARERMISWGVSKRSETLFKAASPAGEDEVCGPKACLKLSGY